MKTKKTKEAVSLIVLVLTIVILIILASIVITNLSNSGIINRGKTAVSETNLKQMQEMATMAWGELIVEDVDSTITEESIKAQLIISGIAAEELDKYDFEVTTGGVKVSVGSGSSTPEEPESEVPQINVALNPSGIIPEGASYYVGALAGDGDIEFYDEYIEENATAKLTAGDEFPKTISSGDVYIYETFIYIYDKQYHPDISIVYDESDTPDRMECYSLF